MKWLMAMLRVAFAFGVSFLIVGLWSVNGFIALSILMFSFALGLVGIARLEEDDPPRRRR